MSDSRRMSADEVRELRERLGWSQTQLSAVLTDALGSNYGRGTVGHWETGRRPVPAAAAAFLEQIALAPEDAPEPPQKPAKPPRGTDTAPTPDGPQMASQQLYAGSTYATVCEQFFELIATGVGMIGAGIGSPALRADGAAILEDKQALGAAWGKLAETNETFRNMILATDKQGAYLAVALATGTTAGKIWRNHAAPPSPPIVSADEQLREDVADAAAG